MSSGVQNTIISPALRDLFANHWQYCRVIFFCAPCGTGKTCAAAALLSGRKVSSYSAFDPDCLRVPFEPGCDAVIVDDLHNLKNETDQQTLCAWINQNPDKHFILLSRGPLPGFLTPYQFTGLLGAIETDSMRFGIDAVKEMLVQHGAHATDAEARELLTDTGGYPLFIAALSRRMAGGASYDLNVLDQARGDVFRYLEGAVFHRFSPAMRRLLFSLTPFQRFNAEIATLASGDSHVGDLLRQILLETSMVDRTGVDNFRFWSIFHRFLCWEMELVLTMDEVRAIYSRAGLYYELHDDYSRALDCYVKSGEHDRVSQILIKNAERHPGLAHYDEMEPYYLALTREEVLRSPALMCGMSMLSSLLMDYEASEEWYRELQNYASRLTKTDAEYRDIRGKIAYLDISLSQRGSRGLDTLIKQMFTMLTNREIHIPALSVTSCLPSVLNGGKDFCIWSKKDDLFYAALRMPVEAILGRDGVALADCALCESKLEKGEDISARLFSLMARVSEIRRKGTPDVLFVAMGLLARAQVLQGKADAALQTLNSLREDFSAAEHARFLPNLDAMRCRVWLRTGALHEAGKWLRENAPNSVPHFRILCRYQYLTKAMVQIARNDCQEALITLAPFLAYCEHCERTMDALHVNMLISICHHRMGDGAWRVSLSKALDTAAEYGFVTPVAQYGAAILPLLAACGRKKDEAFFAHLLAAARAQAAYYPNFLQPPSSLSEPLSPAETQVLRFLCYNRSNQEIADTLGVKLTTIKTQVRSILQKLGVSRRGEAKEAAERLNLL